MERGEHMPKMTLKAARINAGLTQNDAAKKLNVSNKTLSNWENYISTPNANKIDAICTLYNISYDNVIFFKQENA